MTHSPEKLILHSYSRRGDSDDAYGEGISGHLRVFYLATPQRRLPYLAWDLDHSDEERFSRELEETLQGTDEACFAYIGQKPLAAAFAVAMNPACAMLHMWIVENRPDALKLSGYLFCRALLGRYQLLLALLPQAFRGGLELARSLGFRKRLTIPMGCALESFRKRGQPCRRVSGILLTLERG